MPPSGSVPTPTDLLLRRLALAGMSLCTLVVVLGAWVRLTDAGLGCPDWPTCYGHVTPPADLAEPHKAWHEMIHRYAASTLGLVVVAIAGVALTRRDRHSLGVRLPLALLGVVLLQGLLGALTVWLLVTPVVVVLHLLGGLTTLALFFWIWARTRARAAPAAELAPARAWTFATLLVLVVQIALGGWTSSNYAAVACPDFPLCRGAWVPEMDLSEAFVPLRPLGVDYTGGVLEGPARVAIHFTHRLGALLLCLLLAIATGTVLRSPHASRAQRSAARLALAALGLQLTLGAAMILRGFPVWLATLHAAGAALLLLSTLGLLRRLSEPVTAAAPEHALDHGAARVAAPS